MNPRYNYLTFVIFISVIFIGSIILFGNYSVQFCLWKNMPDCNTIDLKYSNQLYWNSPLPVPGELKGQVVKCYHNTFESLDKGMFNLGVRNAN